MATADSTKQAQRLVAALAHEMPYETAAAWVHAGALAQHATSLGLVDPQPSIEATIKALAESHPALAGLADPAVNRMWTAASVDPSPIEALWSQHDFAGPATRGGIDTGYHLGDLYQWLSVEANKGRALCQTPRFITDLLLHCTLPHAIEQWGLDALRMIDPSCGTGHILVDTFLAVWRQGIGHNDRIGRALAAVHGVDLDPYAAALAQYRLLAAACRLNGGAYTLATAPREWMPQMVCADSLLSHDEPVLARGQYHLVIGNPPYIVARDTASADAIRKAYPQVCSGKFSLALPFFQLMTDLCVPGGWIAQLTANSFMKREFGKKFINNYLPTLDLRWIIDTSGAYIPGHGTPTVILIHRNQSPASDSVRTVLGIKGEPKAPADPAQGFVWREIDSKVRMVESVERFCRGANAALAAAQPAPVADLPAPTPAAPETFTQPSLFDLLEAA